MAKIAFENGVFLFTGPGFYAILESQENRVIHKIGYLATGAVVRNIRPMVADVNGLDSVFASPLAAFLFVLHQSGLELASKVVAHDLDKDIQSNGLDFSIGTAGYVDGQYDGIEALDFSVLTGRKYYPYLPQHLRIPENFNTETQEFEVTARPPLSEVQDGENDELLDALKHLGISGLIGRLYATGAMTWQEYIDCANHFWYGDLSRIKKEISRLQFLLPKLLQPVLNAEKKQQLILIGLGDDA